MEKECLRFTGPETSLSAGSGGIIEVYFLERATTQILLKSSLSFFVAL